MKKILVLLTAVFYFCGCTNISQNKDTTQGAKTLKILKGKWSHEIPHDQMEVFKMLEKKTGITVVWDNPPRDNFSERYNIMMNSGNLPDIIVDMPQTDVFKYGQSGVIMTLNDLIKDNMPNLSEWMEKKPDLRKGMMYSDGKYYFLPFFDEYQSGNSCLGVRADWMEKLKLPEPVTIEDWYNVWTAMKNQNPNDGSGDVIPFSGSSFNTVRSLIQAFGILDGLYSDPRDGGRIHYGPLEPRYKEALEWLNKMYAEKLIDPEIITNDEKAFQAKVAQNLVGSTRTGNGTYINFNATLPERIPGFKMVSTPPIKGPYGEQIHSGLDSMPRTIIGAVITSKCTDPKSAAKWIDYFYSDEGALLINMGIKDQTYVIKDGVPVFSDNVLNDPEKLGPKNILGRISIGQSAGPYVFLKSQADSLDDEMVKYAKKNHIEPYIEESLKYILPRNLQISKEDEDKRRQIMNEINTYVDEHVMLMIIGKEPLSNWDTFVEKIKEMKIEEVITITQKAYDRWKEV